MTHKRGEAVCDRQGQLLGWIRAISRRTDSLTIETSTWDTTSRSFVGRAKDGTDVTLGDTPDSTERYLHTHPSSQDW